MAGDREITFVLVGTHTPASDSELASQLTGFARFLRDQHRLTCREEGHIVPAGIDRPLVIHCPRCGIQFTARPG